MIRIEATRTVIWFRLACDPTRKIEWELSEYLAYAKSHTQEVEFRRALLNVGGIVSYLTERDLEELNGDRRLARPAKTAG